MVEIPVENKLVDKKPTKGWVVKKQPENKEVQPSSAPYVKKDKGKGIANTFVTLGPILHRVGTSYSASTGFINDRVMTSKSFGVLNTVEDDISLAAIPEVVQEVVQAAIT